MSETTVDRYAIRKNPPVPTPIPTPQPATQALTITTLKTQVDLLGQQLTQITAGAHALNNVTHVHTQAVPSARWEITHNFTDKFPAVTVIDSGGNEVIGDVQYVGSNQVVLTFAAEFSGKAYLN